MPLNPYVYMYDNNREVMQIYASKYNVKIPTIRHFWNSPIFFHLKGILLFCLTERRRICFFIIFEIKV